MTIIDESENKATIASAKESKEWEDEFGDDDDGDLNMGALHKLSDNNENGTVPPTILHMHDSFTCA